MRLPRSERGIYPFACRRVCALLFAKFPGLCRALCNMLLNVLHNETRNFASSPLYILSNDVYDSRISRSV